jgi:UDP-4-amino-4,6-dideoxy-N-acetyl-beta-L-altrosamine transaminase
MIPYGRQNISEADIQAVVDVLRSDFLTQGPAVPAFEQAVIAHCGARYGIAVNSATSALHIACLALGVGPGDSVWTSPITFIASSNAALYCGGRVEFVDIDPRTNNLSVDVLTERLVAAEREGRLPKVVIPVHLGGQSCEMAAIHALSLQYGFRIVEDASHAIGGRYKGEPIGNCRYSDITVFSFHPVKVITTAEGGMALTNDPDLANSLQLLRSHGMTRDPAQMTHESDGPWYYQQIALGFNYRITDIQATLGSSQVRRLDEFITTRHDIAAKYDRLLADLPVVPPPKHPDCYSALHLYVIRLKLDEIGRSYREVFEAMRAAGVGVNLHYIPVYTQPYYQRLGVPQDECPNADRYYGEAMSLPIFPGLSDEELQYIVDALRQATLSVSMAAPSAV